MTRKPKAARAIMADRRTAPDALEDFPTPPWGTRALTRWALPAIGVSLANKTVREPTANRGLMVAPLEEAGAVVMASDVFDYGAGFKVLDYLDMTTLDRDAYDWTIFNPPFRPALQFLERAMAESRVGVAMLNASRWTEGLTRYRDLLGWNPPHYEFFFVERLPIHEGVWDPEGDTATAYSWFVWLLEDKHQFLPCSASPVTVKVGIPPGFREQFHDTADMRFAKPAGPLFD